MPQQERADYKDDSVVQLAVFLLDNQLYGIDINKIKQIIRPLKITPLPHAPDFLEGVVDLRGVVIPVVDMRKRFSLPALGEDKERKVIIVSVSRKILGIMVDDVTEVISMSKSDLQPPPRVIRGVEADYLNAVARYKEDILLILNLDEILTSEEKVSLETVGGKKKT
ncbi:MAG: chemotaxis protein CheW [bacterium]